MDIFLWVTGSMLAAVGLVQIIGWLVCRGGGAGAESYHVVRLHKNPEKLKEQLRHEVLLAHWDISYRKGPLVLVNAGLDEEGQILCEEMSRDIPETLICTPEELALLMTAR
jgi:hypothetical protein